MKKRATIYDVAAAAGVSISTVSRVLNNPDKVRPETRERVMEAIDRLGFVPKVEAMVRARQGTHRIGVLAPFFTLPSFVQRLHGIALALSESPYELVIYNVDSVARRDSYISTLTLPQRLDGLIVMAMPLPPHAVRRFSQAHLEVVLIEIEHPECTCILIDNVTGGRMAAEHLIRKGHRRIAFVGDSHVPPYSLHNSAPRLEGFRQALEDAGVPLPKEYIALDRHGLEPARQLGHRLLGLSRPPTAVFAASDTQAMGVLQAARERGAKVPDDLAVIGFDDIPIADYIGLTTVRQPLQESGRVAIELLLARLNDPGRVVQHVQLPLTVVERSTT
ncbi:MAG: LacI family DNA-binding transcriptional regulator [Anaerolineae bacterium]